MKACFVVALLALAAFSSPAYAQTPTPTPTVSNECRKLGAQKTKATATVTRRTGKLNQAIANRNRQANLNEQQLAALNEKARRDREVAKDRAKNEIERIEDQVKALEKQRDSCRNFLLFQCSDFHKRMDAQIEREKNKKDGVKTKEKDQLAKIEERRSKRELSINTRLSRFESRILERQAEVDEAKVIQRAAQAAYDQARCP